MTTRYVVTHIGKDGLRTLACAAQGRNTFETAAEARAHLSAMVRNNDPRMLAKLYGFPLQVRAVECWPGHFDPKGVYFDDAEVTP